MPDNPAKTNFWKIGFFISLLFLLGAIVFIYFIYTFPNKLQEKRIEKASAPSPTITNPSPQLTQPSPSLEKEESSWRRTDSLGVYSFEYPHGWHVANQWPNEMEQGISIFIDPEPINTAPRGGPISAIMINDKSGLDNPDEVFDKDKESFKNFLQDLEEETIKADFGIIYFYKGKINVYEQMMPTERYYFMIQGAVSTTQGPVADKANKHVIMASLEGDISNSEILRRIVTSFKKN